MSTHQWINTALLFLITALVVGNSAASITTIAVAAASLLGAGIATHEAYRREKKDSSEVVA